jgi:hypothetical protein
MFFHGASHEKVMSLYFLQLRLENIKVMANAKNKKATSCQLLSRSSQLLARSFFSRLFTCSLKLAA